MPLKVLVVDDATFVRDMVKRTLRKLVPNVELHEAPDGARAVKLIKSKKPDLILSDWEMPEMGGDELLRWVREEPDFSDTPFIMITSRGDRNHVMAAVSAGVNDYLSKPFTQEELTRKVGKQLKKIGFEYKPGAMGNPENRGFAFASVDVLTGGKSIEEVRVNKPSPQAQKTKSRAGPKFKGTAFLRFPKYSLECDIREISIQALCGVMPKPESLPTVFDQASVDLISEKGEVIARLNAYVHSIAATEPNPNAERVRVIVRFVDDDPAKLEVLSSLIA